jgi:pimeloyl-ACP methyl ester carboxylesterase
MTDRLTVEQALVAAGGDIEVAARSLAANGGNNSTDERLFRAFSQEPEEVTDHEEPDVHVPLEVRTGKMTWQSRKTMGTVLRPGPGNTQKADDAYGLEIHWVPEGLNSDTNVDGDPVHDVGNMWYGEHTTKFQIAYTVMYPATKTDQDSAQIALLHGVPMNRKAKYAVMKRLAKAGAFCVCFDMLGMGESDKPLHYHYNKDHARRYFPPNGAWDWKNDVPYVHQLLTQELPEQYGVKEDGWVFQADDWGAGIALHYAAQYSDTLSRLQLVNPIYLDGYFVIEIGTIGEMARLRQQDPKAFYQAASGLPQAMIGIEKYMVEHKNVFNNATERTFLGPYRNANYQDGKVAADKHSHFWNIQVLADRSAHLAPRQLLPRHNYAGTGAPTEVHGVAYSMIRCDVDVIWGTLDQMMPPHQMFRSIYLYPNARSVNIHPIEGANHFSELDQPDRVARAMLWAVLSTKAGRDSLPPLLWLGNDFRYKGDEKKMQKLL